MHFYLGGMVWLAADLFVCFLLAHSPSGSRTATNNARWAANHGVTATETSGPIIAKTLRRNRQIRRWGLLLPFAIGTVPNAVIVAFWQASDQRHVLDTLPWLVDVCTSPVVWIVGYLIGAFAAGLVPVQMPAETGHRTALLIPRRVENYVPSRIILAARCAAALAITSGIVVWIVKPAHWHRGSAVIADAAAVLVLAVCLELTGRLVANRRQSGADMALATVDDALRSETVASVARFSCSSILFLLSLILIMLGRAISDNAFDASNPHVLFVATNVVRVFAVAAFVLAVWVWARYDAERARSSGRLNAEGHVA